MRWLVTDPLTPQCLTLSVYSNLLRHTELEKRIFWYQFSYSKATAFLENSLLKLFCDLRQGQKATSTKLSTPLVEVIITTMVNLPALHCKSLKSENKGSPLTLMQVLLGLIWKNWILTKEKFTSYPLYSRKWELGVICKT